MLVPYRLIGPLTEAKTIIRKYYIKKENVVAVGIGVKDSRTIWDKLKGVEPHYKHTKYYIRVGLKDSKTDKSIPAYVNGITVKTYKAGKVDLHAS